MTKGKRSKGESWIFNLGSGLSAYDIALILKVLAFYMYGNQYA